MLFEGWILIYEEAKWLLTEARSILTVTIVDKQRRRLLWVYGPRAGPCTKVCLLGNTFKVAKYILEELYVVLHHLSILIEDFKKKSYLNLLLFLTMENQ